MPVEPDGARRFWWEAAQLFESHDMQGQLAAVRVRLADLSEGARSSELRELAYVWFEAEGIADPDRFVDTIAPGRATATPTRE